MCAGFVRGNPCGTTKCGEHGLDVCPAGETNSGDHDTSGIDAVCNATACEANEKTVSHAGHHAQQSNSRGKQNDFGVTTFSGTHRAENV